MIGTGREMTIFWAGCQPDTHGPKGRATIANRRKLNRGSCMPERSGWCGYDGRCGTTVPFDPIRGIP